MPDSWWTHSFTESQREWEGEGRENFSLKIRPHVKFQIVAYEMRKKKDFKIGNFVLYHEGYKLHFRFVLVFKRVRCVLARSLENWTLVAKAIIDLGLSQYFKIKTPKVFYETAVKLQTLL